MHEISPQEKLQVTGTRPMFRTTLVAVLILWATFTAIHALDLGEPLGAILFFIPGLLGISILMWTGLKREECYLRVAPISRAVLIALVVSLPVLIPILISGEWAGWNWASVFL